LEGRNIWTHHLKPSSETEELWSTPAVEQDTSTVYSLLGSGVVVAIDTTNKREKWRLDLKERE